MCYSYNKWYLEFFISDFSVLVTCSTSEIVIAEDRIGVVMAMGKSLYRLWYFIYNVPLNMV